MRDRNSQKIKKLNIFLSSVWSRCNTFSVCLKGHLYFNAYKVFITYDCMQYKPPTYHYFLLHKINITLPANKLNAERFVPGIGINSRRMVLHNLALWRSLKYE